MAINSPYAMPYGTKGGLDTLAGASGLIPNVQYWCTDTNKIAVALTTSTYIEIPKDDIRTINFVIDGGGAAITTGVKGDLVLDFAGTILGWTILGDVSGSIVVDIWKDTYANFPPVVGDTITASAKPTLASALKNQNTTLTGWTTAFAAGDILRWNVDSATTVQRATVALKVRAS